MRIAYVDHIILKTPQTALIEKRLRNGGTKACKTAQQVRKNK